MKSNASLRKLAVFLLLVAASGNLLFSPISLGKSPERRKPYTIDPKMTYRDIFSYGMIAQSNFAKLINRGAYAQSYEVLGRKCTLAMTLVQNEITKKDMIIWDLDKSCTKQPFTQPDGKLVFHLPDGLADEKIVWDSKQSADIDYDWWDIYDLDHVAYQGRLEFTVSESTSDNFSWKYKKYVIEGKLIIGKAQDYPFEHYEFEFKGQFQSPLQIQF